MQITDLFNLGNSTLRLGLIREGKIPLDRRVALNPQQAAYLEQQHQEDLSIWVETSDIRCFTDSEYRAAGLQIAAPQDMDQCDILFGIKEVPENQLIEKKTYFFFSHTSKKQPYNRRLLQTILDKKIRLIDYEFLVDDQNRRLIGFGVFAGNVGAHYALMMLGKRRSAFDLAPAWQWRWKSRMLNAYSGLSIPPERIVVTGKGRVSQGVVEVLNAAGIYQVKPDEFLRSAFDMPVYTILDAQQLYRRTDGHSFTNQDFYDHPEAFASNFAPYTRQATMLINGMFWDHRAPRLFQAHDVQRSDFSLEIIADITCDLNGSVPINIRETTTEQPFYGLNRKTLTEGRSFEDQSIDMMTISNLPNELAPDASSYFGKVLSSQIIPELLYEAASPMLQRATIAQQGRLTERFSYLEDYVSTD